MNWLIGTVGAFAILALVSEWGAGRAEQQFPPIGAFVEVVGIRMHYREAGQGSPLVLIHGASTNLRDFSASIFEPLSRSHRVIAIDRPGHGYSERPAGDWPDPARQAQLIRQVLDKLEVDKPILVGHSWSGSVVLAYLLDYPQDAAGGVLLAGGTHPWQGGVAWYNDLAGVPVLGELFARTLAFPVGLLALDGAVREVFGPNPVPADYNQTTGIKLSLRPQVFRANAEDVRMLSDFLSVQSRRYADITQPLLLLTGSADDIVPAWNHADRLILQASSAELVELKDTGHALHHAHPNEVVARIESFADRVKIAANRSATASAD